MGCCGECLAKILHIFLRIIETAIAIAIIIIVAVHLQDHTVSLFEDGNDAVDVKFQCMLGNTVQQANDDSSANLCAYTYAVCGISLGVTLVVSLLLCITCNLCGGGVIIELIAMCFLCVWWIICGSVLSKQAADTNDITDDAQEYFDNLWDLKFTQKDWRNTVVILAWIAALCFFIEFVICCCRLLCGCCGGKDSELKEEKKKRKEAEKEAAKLRAEQGVADKEAVPV